MEIPYPDQDQRGDTLESKQLQDEFNYLANVGAQAYLSMKRGQMSREDYDLTIQYLEMQRDTFAEIQTNLHREP